MMASNHDTPVTDITAIRHPLGVGADRVVVEVPSDRWLPLNRAEQPPALADPVQALADALESPLRYPPLRQALTPEDHVTVVVDEHLPRLAELVRGVLEHIVSAGVDPSAITLLCPPTASKQAWIEDLPDAFEDVRLEVHDPSDRKQLAYLATTKSGHRIYLNRSAVDADQTVVLTGPHFDLLHGYAGAEADLFPALGDAESRQRSDRSIRTPAPAEGSPSRGESGEVSWLLGAPFYVQVLEGAGDDIAHVIGGAAESAADGRRWLDRHARVTADEADLVIATMTGDPARQTINDMARALAAAVRVVRADGAIALLTAATPDLGEGFRRMLRVDDADSIYRDLKADPPADWPAVYHWLTAVRRARVYLLSGLPDEVAEGLFTTPMQHARQVQRLIDAGGSVLVLPDAHKLLPEISS